MRLLDNMSLKRKKAVFGFLLLTPYLIGFVLFFVLPVIKSLVFSFNNITSEVGRGVIYRPVGLNHYIRLFTTEVAFRKACFNVVDLYVNVPMIVIYSLFIAVVLNKRFRGRNFAKVIFFLPVIITSGVMLSMESATIFYNQYRKQSARATSCRLKPIMQRSSTSKLFFCVCKSVKKSSSI